LGYYQNLFLGVILGNLIFWGQLQNYFFFDLFSKLVFEVIFKFCFQKIFQILFFGVIFEILFFGSVSKTFLESFLKFVLGVIFIKETLIFKFVLYSFTKENNVLAFIAEIVF
jgi:hypothetical protein